MGFKFNPFSGNFDQTGSGGGGSSYIDGEVATYNDLPLDGTAALNSAWLVRTASGVWPVSRKQAGIYIRTATGGSNRDADYTYAGTMPDVFSDSQFLLYENSDTSRNLAFDLGSIATGTTRTLTVPNASGRIQVEGQPIGDTTRNTGAFTTITANNGTLTASAPVLDVAQTWNNAAVTFTGLNLALTNTASASASAYLSLGLDGTQIFSIRRGESSAPATLITCGGSGVTWTARTRTGAGVGVNFSGVVGVGTNLQFGTGAGTTGGDLVLLRDDAANVFAQRNGTSAQTFRLYSTYTDASNYERGFMRWSGAGGTLQIGTEALGTGSARALELQTGGTTRVTIATNGAITCSSGLTVVTSIGFQGNSSIVGNISSGVIRLLDSGGTGFNRIQFGGSSTSFPALKRSSTVLQSRLADDSDFAPLQGQLRIHQNAVAETPTATHTMTIFDAAGAAYKVLCVAA